MIRRSNLRKVLRFGAVGLVAASTHDGCVQLLRLRRTGVVRMLGLGPVAGLTSDHHVLAQLLLIHDVGVAALAGVVPGKRYRTRGVLADCSTSIVAILPKAARYDRSPQNDESHQRYCDDRR